MLSVQDIARLQLAKFRVNAYQQMPTARPCKPLTRLLTAIADAALGDILGVSPEQFAAQLEDARSMGVSYVHARDDLHIAGLSAYASIVRGDNLLTKSLILPENSTHVDRRLSDHYILGVFIVGNVTDLLNDNSEHQSIHVAGWIDNPGIQANRVELPSRFKSDLPVVAVPVRNLYAMSELRPRLDVETVEI